LSAATADMGKKDKAAKADKADVAVAAEAGGKSYDELSKYVSVIAKPLADEKLCKKALKLAKKAAKKKQIKRGVKEVVKAIRKNAKGCVSSPCVERAMRAQGIRAACT